MAGVQGRVAIVTGGSRGIGQAISELFAEGGATVIIWDLLDEGADVAKGINEKGGTAEFVKLSVTDQDAINAAVQDAVSKYGKIDILINNAGITRDKSLLKMEDSQWHSVIDVNLNSIYYCCKAVAPVMKENGYGRIISASSTTGVRGNYGQVNYAAAKAGILGMTKTLAVELGRYGVTVNAIAPGYTQTAMTDAIPDNIKALAKTQIPVGFLADPIDLAHGYLFLASEEARFVSGICLPIDGGVTR